MNRKAVSRREAIGTIGAAGAAFAFGCGESPASPATGQAAGSTTSTNAACAVTPAETAGPFPNRSDLFRSDVRENRAGSRLTLTIKIVNGDAACAAVAGATVEIWHCDAAGDYSEYGSQRNRTFLRGVQATSGTGEVTFTTIYPGWYPGRATHIHVEVSTGGASRKVTQIAFPETVNNLVHDSGVYASHGTNPTTNLADGIFADSLAAELVTPTGDPATGYTAACQVVIQL